MTKEQKTITVNCYRTPDGKPTCASDFSCGDVCQFHGTTHYGTRDVCMIGDGESIYKYGEGFMCPTSSCIVWK